jgi:hypothetical protein
MDDISRSLTPAGSICVLQSCLKLVIVPLRFRLAAIRKLSDLLFYKTHDFSPTHPASLKPAQCTFP